MGQNLGWQVPAAWGAMWLTGDAGPPCGASAHSASPTGFSFGGEDIPPRKTAVCLDGQLSLQGLNVVLVDVAVLRLVGLRPGGLPLSGR